MSLDNAANIIVSKCLGLKPNESCLIITDENKKDIGKILYDAAKKISEKTEMIEIPIGKFNGEEPNVDVAKKMLDYNVLIIPTTMSLSHTNARINATNKGIRLATLPGITKDIMTRAINVDYDEMKELTNKICDILDKGTEIKVTTSLGTDINFDISNVISHGRKAGLFTKKGYWGNLPDAECFLAPKNANGVYVVDASHAGIGKIDEPIKITVENGYATKIEGGVQAEELKKMLVDVNDKNAYNLAELGIGTNKKAKVTGKILEDEKVLGTCHVALGKNKGFGGSIDVPIHVDGVIKSPTIYVDDKKIMENGKLTL